MHHTPSPNTVHYIYNPPEQVSQFFYGPIFQQCELTSKKWNYERACAFVWWVMILHKDKLTIPNKFNRKTLQFEFVEYRCKVEFVSGEWGRGLLVKQRLLWLANDTNSILILLLFILLLETTFVFPTTMGPF